MSWDQTSSPLLTLKVNAQTYTPGFCQQVTWDHLPPLSSYLKDRPPVAADARPEILKKHCVMLTSYVIHIHACAHTRNENT